MNATQPTPSTPTLFPMPPIAGSEKIPASVFEAERSWQRAEKEVAEGQYLAAATAFLNIARSLRLAPESFYGELAVDARGYAYRNAAICFSAAGARELARRRLGEARDEDPEARADIDEAIAMVRL